MIDNTVYLLYNTNAKGIKLHRGPSPMIREDKNGLAWEYIDKDEFTIMYSADDDRQSTDIKILSKTKLKDRPKSAEVLMKQPKGSVEGVLIRRTSSFSTIEELFLVRRSPLIKPLLSELEIRRLQQLQEECRKKQLQYIERDKLTGSIRTKDTLTRKYSVNQDSEADDGGTLKLTSLESPKEKLRGITPSLELDKRKVQTAPSESEKVLKGNITTTKRIDFSPKGEATTIAKTKLMLTTNKVAQEKAKLKKDNKTHGSVEENKSIERKRKPATKSAERKSSINKSEKGMKDKGNKKIKKKPSSLELQEESVMSSKGISKKARSKKHDDSAAQSKTTKSKQRGSNLKKGGIMKDEEGTSKLEQSREAKSSIAGKSNKSGKSDQNSVDKSDKPRKGKSQKPGKKKYVKSDDVSSVPVEKAFKKISIKEKKKKSKYEEENNDVSIDKAKSAKVKNLRMREGGSEKASAKTVSEGQVKSGVQSEHHPTSTSKRKSIRSSGVPLSIPRLKGNITDEHLHKKSRKMTTVFQNMIQYVLSNPVFIKLGWTLRPGDRAMSRMVTFKTLPANPQAYCFRNRDEVETKFYPSGSLAVKMEEDGTGRVNYVSGEPAMIITKNDTGMRLTLYYDKTRDSVEKQVLCSRVSGLFDSGGNGVVYDCQGNKILYFNQLQGIFNNPATKSVYKWKWRDYKILEKQRVKELLSSMVTDEKQPEAIQEKKAAGSSGRGVKKQEVDKVYESVLAELPYPVAGKSKVKIESRAPGFKAIILKINEEITLRINGQDNVIVNFSTNKIFYRVDLGVQVDPETVDRIDDLATDRVSDVPCVFDAMLNLSPSLQQINQQLDLSRGLNKKTGPRKKLS